MPRQSALAIEALEGLLHSLGVLSYREKRIGEEIGDDQIDAVIAAFRSAVAAIDANHGALVEDDAAALVLAFLDAVLLPALNGILYALAVDSSAPLPAHSSGHDTRSLVSMKNLIVVNCAIELLFYWGVAAYASEKLGIDLAEKQFPSKMLLSKDHVTGVFKRLQSRPSAVQVHAYISCLRACASHNSFKTWMLQRNMKRIILVFLALSTHHLKEGHEETAIASQSKAVLDEMKTCSSLQHLVVGELRWAARCNSDIKSASQRMFSDILTSKGGLYNVILAYMQNMENDDPSNLKIALHVALLVSSVPSHMTKLQYFSIICPDLVETYAAAHGNNDVPLMRVCAMVSIRVAKVAPELADALIIANWTKHLSSLYDSSNSNSNSSDNHTAIMEDSSSTSSLILADERTLSTSVGVLGSMLTLCPASPTIIECFRRCGTGRLLIALLLEVQLRCRSSYILRPLHELCQTYLSHIAPADAASDVEAALLGSVSCDVCSAADGGVELRRRGAGLAGKGGFGAVGRIRLDRAETSLGIRIADITGGVCRASSEDVLAPREDLQEVLDSLSAASIVDGGEGARCMMLLAEKSRVAVDLLLAVDRREGADSSDSSISSALFLLSMRSFLGAEHGTYAATRVVAHTYTDARAAASLLVLTMLSIVPMDIVLRKCGVVLELIAAYLDSYAQTSYGSGAHHPFTRGDDDAYHDAVGLDGTEEGDEMLEAILNILESVLVLGKSRHRPGEEEEEGALRQLLPSLQTLSLSHPSPAISLSAANAVLLLITRSSDRRVEQEAVVAALAEQTGRSRVLQDMLLEWKEEGLVNSPSPAMRGLAVRNLISYLHDRRNDAVPKEEVRLALQTALSFLADSDSFVYLHALKAISVLASYDMAGVASALLSIFLADTNVDAASVPAEISACLVSMRRRALLGDALSLLVRRHRETVAPILPGIVAGCVRMLRVVQLPSTEEGRQLDAAFDLRALRTIKSGHRVNADNSSNDDGDDGGGEGGDGGEVENGTDALGEAVLLRQSAISLLADAVAASGWGAARYLQDVVDIAIHVISVERLQKGGANEAMRRSAAFLLQHLVSGLQQRLLYVHDAGHHLKRIYATLKVIANDRDKVVKFQAERALAFLREMVIEELKPLS